MAEHKFGGVWTAQKLNVLRDYLNFFTTALEDKSFKLVYIDTFAGTGRCTIKTNAAGESEIEGSATIALEVKRPFDEYHFVERKARHLKELQKLKAIHRLGARVTITRGDATKKLKEILQSYDWTRTRGVLFLDPYGLSCTWDMVRQIAATKALDVFFLVSLSGLTRQASTDFSKIDEGKANALDRFLGTTDWRTALYKPPPIDDLFGGGPSLVRDPGTEAIAQFVKARMINVFPYVGEPVALRNKKNAVMFELYFAVSNDAPKAIGLAGRVSKEILAKIQ